MNIGMENEILEFKKSTAELEEGIISLTAMLNKHGKGTVYFGVKNNGDVVGLKELTDNSIRKVSRKIAEGIDPQIIPHISIEYYGELKVIRVSVKGNEVPYSAFGIYYNRSFDEDKKLSLSGLKALINKDGEPDLILDKVSEKQDLTFETLKLMYKNKGFKINEKKFEENLNLFTPDGKYNYMAYLLADKNDLDIKIATFAGSNKAIMTKRTEYGGKSLLLSTLEVQSYFNVINETKVKVGGITRIEEKYFDALACKEAWLNAVVHTRWVEGVEPLVCIFDDHIEIDSNGGLPAALSIEDFFEGKSKPVNEKLLKIFKDLQFIDETGHGVPLIKEKYGKKAFKISKHTVRVVIPINKELLEQNTTADYNSYNDINASESKILYLIKGNEKINTSGLMKETNLSEPYINKILSALKQKNYIERVGSNKTGHWRVLK